MVETDVYGRKEAIQDVSWDNDALARRLERWVVGDDEKTVRRNAGILQVAFDVWNLIYLFGGPGALS